MTLHRAGQASSRHGFVESFNGRLRDECLNEHACPSLAAARRIVEAERNDYNDARPHSSPRAPRRERHHQRNVSFRAEMPLCCYVPSPGGGLASVVTTLWQR